MLGRLANNLVQFLKQEDGPTAVEYAVMLALIIAVCFAAVANIGGTTSSMYNNLSLQSVGKGSAS
jgi:pilus assembly protein Flp/PilA